MFFVALSYLLRGFFFFIDLFLSSLYLHLYISFVDLLFCLLCRLTFFVAFESMIDLSPPSLRLFVFFIPSSLLLRFVSSYFLSLHLFFVFFFASSLRVLLRFVSSFSSSLRLFYFASSLRFLLRFVSSSSLHLFVFFFASSLLLRFISSFSFSL